MSSEPESREVTVSPLAEAAGVTRRRRWRPLDDIEAVVLGIRDTFHDMLEAGREEAERAHREAWQRYDDLTKHRKELKRREEGDDED